MRLPRLRLSIRRMMAAVVVFALALVYVLPEGQRLLWLYRHPAAVMNFTASILCRPAPGEPTRADASRPTYPIGRPFRMQVDSTSIPASFLPGGLGFGVDVVVRVTDPKNFKITYSEQRRRRRVRSGEVGADGGRETDIFEVRPPGAGSYAVRYELEVSDLFGRKNIGASGTNFFTSR